MGPPFGNPAERPPIDDLAASWRDAAFLRMRCLPDVLRIALARRRLSVRRPERTEVAMTRDGSNLHADLLREAMTGRSSRRSMVRRGLRLGLSVPALAGLLLVRQVDQADAQFTKCVVVMDKACAANCASARTFCQMAGNSNCASQYSACLGGCSNVECS
jgi:hypothetical protein